ncbi:EscU/YscU/HrcU family type III secretion system export apparatus switch protein [Candidatus Symbiobacter mobilis]|uniref:Flagellar biosynthetic protein FlhB n=1 Tax=Candidatus Symbiobacter mobilis CR TaxID=946483 RepID=U5N7A9_9BURK|nr:EscU/YscU/HrcU family type III secretion system export apparatus switch protein [Candidatus Symbiobacter mobilis]AGX87391.1 flagellar biosynthetic protein FlhB [Candidatus Symbiobacter mobilis CR]
MDSGSQDRNLPATEHKLRKARDDGQVARSRDLTHLAVLGAGAACLVLLGPTIFQHLHNELGIQLTFDVHAVHDPLVMTQRLGAMVAVGLTATVALGAIISLVAMLGNVATGGLVHSLKPITPDLTRLDPLAGFGRLFSKDKLFETAKMVFIASMLLVVGYLYLSSGLEHLRGLVLQPGDWAVAYLSHWLYQGLGMLLLIILVVAVIDIPLQQFLHKSRLKMSHQEVKQENKESEGNPEMKGHMRRRQSEIANGNSIQAVPKADFVVMNPTHYAVAIRYDESAMQAPHVIAKGADLLAFKIRDLARECEIPVLQAPVLARALYAHAELDREIPSTLYTAVAQVLAYVYRLRSAMRGNGPMPDEPPQPFVPPELDPHSRVIGAAIAQ